MDTVQLEEDLYWEVSYEQFTAIGQQVDALEVGSLTEDWQILQNTLANGILLDSNDFNRMANILKAIGLKIEALSEVER